MTNINAEDYLDLIRRVAHSFNRTTHLDYEELYCEGCLVFTKATRSYNPAKGQFTTWLTWVVTNHLRDYIKQEYHYLGLKQDSVRPEDCLALTKPTQPRQAGFREGLERLSQDAQEICQFIFDTPGDYFCGTHSKLSRGAVWGTLKERGWSSWQIQRGIKEIKYFLNEMVA